MCLCLKIPKKIQSITIPLFKMGPISMQQYATASTSIHGITMQNLDKIWHQTSYFPQVPPQKKDMGLSENSVPHCTQWFC